MRRTCWIAAPKRATTNSPASAITCPTPWRGWFTLVSAASAAGILIVGIVPIAVRPPFLDIRIIEDRGEVIAVLGKCDYVQWQITVAIELSIVADKTLNCPMQGASLVNAALELAQTERICETTDAFRRAPPIRHDPFGLRLRIDVLAGQFAHEPVRADAERSCERRCFNAHASGNLREGRSQVPAQAYVALLGNDGRQFQEEPLVAFEMSGDHA